MTEKRMDIHAAPGTKLVFKYPEDGYDWEINAADNCLVIGKTYTLLKTRVSGYHTTVWLEEFPEVAFNSIQFAEAET